MYTVKNITDETKKISLHDTRVSFFVKRDHFHFEFTF